MRRSWRCLRWFLSWAKNRCISWKLKTYFTLMTRVSISRGVLASPHVIWCVGLTSVVLLPTRLHLHFNLNSRCDNLKSQTCIKSSFRSCARAWFYANCTIASMSISRGKAIKFPDIFSRCSPSKESAIYRYIPRETLKWRGWGGL